MAKVLALFRKKPPTSKESSPKTRKKRAGSSPIPPRHKISDTRNPKFETLPSWSGPETAKESTDGIASRTELLANPSKPDKDYSNPFSTAPRKMRSRVHTRAAGMARTTSDSDFDLQRTKSQLLERNRESTLQRSTSADNLDEIVAVEGGRLRDRRTSTEVALKYTRRRPSPTVVRRGHSKKEMDPIKILFKPRTVEALVDVLETGVDVNFLNEDGLAPIHAVVLKKRRDRLDLLMAFMAYSEVDVNFETSRGMTSLHISVEAGDEVCVKALLVFGADVNSKGYNEFTPLDLAINNAQVPGIEELLIDRGAKSSAHLLTQKVKFSIPVPKMISYAQQMPPPGKCKVQEFCDGSQPADARKDYLNELETLKLYQELEYNLNRRMSLSMSLGRNPDELVSMTMQQRELKMYSKTMDKARLKPQPEPVEFSAEGGSRILFLDGGGVKGLLQIEILMQIEAKTERKITDLFDWIVGSSTGAIIALGLVYAKLSLIELRQLYLQLKSEIFAHGRMGFAYNSSALERILMKVFRNKRMSDVQSPKVLISAVDKTTTKLELRFFNNCFANDYSTEYVWKVARYTSAGPMFFTEFENYVDGGVLANNPCDFGLTEIQNFYRAQKKKLKIALVVSVGSGVFPAEELGKVDAQEFFFFGKHWFNFKDTIKSRAQNLLALLTTALVESEMVAKNCKSRCEEQGIPFYRLSPELTKAVDTGETDNEKLIDMMLQAAFQTKEQGLDDIIGIFHIVAHASKRLSRSASIERSTHDSIPEESVEIAKSDKH